MKRTNRYIATMTKWNAFINWLEMQKRVSMSWSDYLAYMDERGFLIQ